MDKELLNEHTLVVQLRSECGSSNAQSLFYIAQSLFYPLGVSIPKEEVSEWEWERGVLHPKVYVCVCVCVCMLPLKEESYSFQNTLPWNSLSSPGICLLIILQMESDNFIF